MNTPDNDINNKLDELKDKVHSLELAQVKALNDVHSILKDQHVCLQEHMKRSDTLEAQFDLMQKEVVPVLTDIKSGLKIFKAIFKVFSVIISGLMVYIKLFKKN